MMSKTFADRMTEDAGGLIVDARLKADKFNDIPTATGWHARLDLALENRDTKTCLIRRQHKGPLLVQKPFYPEGGVCHLYLIHPPGGVVGGDVLELNVEVGERCHSLMTTPAAGKFYRSDGRLAVQQQHLCVRENAILEWMPQENIYFDQSIVHQTTRVELAANSRFIGWDIFCPGRPAAAELWSQGEIFQTLEIVCNNKPLLIEKLYLAGGSDMLTASWGFQGYSVSGAFIAYPINQQQQATLRELAREVIELPRQDDCLASVTIKNDVLICRALAHNAEQIRKLFVRMWDLIRPELLSIPALEPRIWQT